MMDVIDPSQLKTLDDKGFIPDETRNAIFRKLRMKPDNRTCFECSSRNPVWISITYGVYVCLECSGEHRRKGVHLSYVRSVDMDKFTPEQIVKMAVGGNGKAWNYFKAHGMGKTSDAGRSLDYSSKITVRYKEQINGETDVMCKQLGVSKHAPAAAEPAKEAAEPVEAPAAAPKAAAGPAAATPSGYVVAPKPVAGPTTTVIRRAAPTAPTAAPTALAAAPAAKPASVPAAGGNVSGAKAQAKTIEFDFDFDDLEKEAAKPVPTPAPAPAAAHSAPKPAAAKPVEAPRPSAAAGGGIDDRFAKKKGISSDDFFHSMDGPSAQERVEQDQRYNKFSNAGAIGSDAFFGNDDGNAAKSGGGGLSKGAEMLTTYLSKVRD